MDAPLSSQRRRALILEDEPMIAMGLTMQIKTLGFDDVAIFRNCSDALAHLQSNDTLLPDIGILDVQLQHRELSLPVAIFLQDARVPFFLLSGHGADNPMSAELPGVVTLNKPVCETHLFALIARLLGDDYPYPSVGD